MPSPHVQVSLGVPLLVRKMAEITIRP